MTKVQITFIVLSQEKDNYELNTFMLIMDQVMKIFQES